MTITPERRTWMTIERATAALVLAAATSICGAVDASDALKPSTGEVLSLRSNAAGAQIYVRLLLTAKSNSGKGISPGRRVFSAWTPREA